MPRRKHDEDEEAVGTFDTVGEDGDEPRRFHERNEDVHDEDDNTENEVDGGGDMESHGHSGGQRKTVSSGNRRSSGHAGRRPGRVGTSNRSRSSGGSTGGRSKTSSSSSRGGRSKTGRSASTRSKSSSRSGSRSKSRRSSRSR
jgi:hypothetical protein